MRVAIFTDNDFEKVNGVTTTLTAVLRHAPPDISPRVYTASSIGVDTPGYLAVPSVGVGIPFYREMRIYWPPLAEYRGRLAHDGVDLLHVTTPGPIGLAALRLATLTGLPLVGSFHTDLSAYTTLLSRSPRLGDLMARYMRWLYGRCAYVLVPSEATRRLLVADGMPAERVVVWPRGVDPHQFTPLRRSPSLRDRWGVDERRPALLYVGRVSAEKGLADLPLISHGLLRAGVHHRLVVVGDGPMRRQLQEVCPDAVFTGTLGREAVADAFASADLFVFPSRTDTAGNVVLEAQASGLPVLVSDQGGPQENLQPGLSGLVCGDIDGFVRGARAVLGEPERLAGMRAAARAYALDRRWEQALAPLYETYRLGGRRPVPPPASSQRPGGVDMFPVEAGARNVA